MIGNSAITGHELMRGALSAMLRAQRMRQVLLFSGPEGVGKALVAAKLAEAIASPQDVHWLLPEGKSALHTVESIRALTEQIHFGGFGDKQRIFLIDRAHKLPTPSAHALLKVLEEPPENVVIVLISSCASALPQTLTSRCLKLHFGALNREEMRALLAQHLSGLPAEESEALLRFGSPGFATRYLLDDNRQRIAASLQLLRVPMSFSQFRRDLGRWEGLISAHLEAKEEQSANRPDWRDLPATTREQLLRSSQAQQREALDVEWQFFAKTLLALALRGALANQLPWRSLPLGRFAEDLQRLEVLWQRGARLGDLLEKHWLSWQLLY